MSELHSIPLTCKEGVYSVFDFYQDADGEDAIFFDYDTQYQMLTYDIPVGQDWRGMTLYSVPEKDIFRTLRACYGEDGGLLKITAVLNGHETLLYIRYEDEEDARKKIRRFAIRNANAIIEQIQQCKDVVARLFIDYYIDSETINYHAMIGTVAQMEAVRQKYHDEDSCDCSGNYPSEYIKGDNEMLITMVRCAEGHPSANFQYAVEIMSKHIENYALPALRRTEDFKFICEEYD